MIAISVVPPPEASDRFKPASNRNGVCKIAVGLVDNVREFLILRERWNI